VELGGWQFEWDPEKARENFKKHKVTFTEAASVFRDPDALDLVDRADPERQVLIGHSERARLLFTVYVEVHGDVIRIISARRATPEEHKEYARHRKK
jgi:uncharacterized DUF497 family protein